MKTRPAALFAGIFFCIVPFLLNEWTLIYFLGDYIGQEMSSHISLLIWMLTICSLSLSVSVFKFGAGILRELRVIVFFCIPACVSTACLYLSGQAMNIADLLYGQLLCIMVCTILTFLFFRWGVLISFLLFCLVGFVELTYASMYKTLISPSAFYNIFETNLQESRGYLTVHFFNFLTLSFVIVSGVLSFLLFKITGALNRKRLGFYLAVVSVVLLVPLVLADGFRKVLPNNLVFKIAKGVQEYNLLYAEVNRFAGKPLDEIEPVSFSQPRPDNELHVFIIGESADRDHMGVYGYERDNSPKIAEMSDELFLFSNVISVHNNTIPNMENMLTSKNYENDIDFTDKGGLIHYLRKAEYDTYWISNQNPMGIHDTMTTVLAKACDSVIFANNSESFRSTSFDEKLLPILQNVITDSNTGRKFVFIHLMGSHEPFDLRYRQEFDKFKGDIDGKTKKQSKIINQYDNSILYTDHIVTEIIKAVKETGAYASVLYTSDHGLEVYDNRNYCGHCLHGGLEIPFVLWLSESYKKINSPKADNFSSWLDRKYSSDDIFHSICDLLNMRFESFETDRSIFSESFTEKIRYVGTPDKETIWDYDLGPGRIDELSKSEFAKQADDFKNKVWAHRINNRDKLALASQLFYGMELDIVFEMRDNIFDVRHPPARTNNLTLDQYWARLDNAGQFKFWLDFKNISPENKAASLARLVQLAAEHQIPHENIMIESKVAFPLKDFKAEGFVTSYWISVGTLEHEQADNFDELGPNARLFLKKIKSELEEYEIDAISFPVESLDQVNKYLPDVEAFNVWAHEMFYDKQEDLIRVKLLLDSNPQIKTFLIRFSY